MSRVRPFRISRRHALRGMGAVMALPFLEAMLPPSRLFGASSKKMSGAVGADGIPVRFAALFMPNGVNHEHWDPKGRSLRKLPRSLQPLQELTDHINVITGITNANGGHAAGTAAFLTGWAPKKTEKPSQVNVRNPSIDQIIGNALKEETSFPTLELGLHVPKSGTGSGHTNVYRSYVSWRTATIPVPHEINPKRAFERLFKGVKETSPQRSAAGKSDYISPDKSVLDIILDDAKSLEKKLGKADRHKLDEYLTAVREVEQRISYQARAAGGLNITRDVLEEIQSVRSHIRKTMKRRGGDEKDLKRYKASPDIPYREHGELMMDVMALAFWSNTTRSGTFMFGDGTSGRNMSFLNGVSGSHHSISHHGNKGEKLKQFTLINAYFAEQYAYFLNRLKGMTEGNSNVLENSVILFGSNISAGQNHRGKNVPLLISGHGGGRIRCGRHIEAKGESIAKVHRSILDVMNVDAKIGDGKGTLKGFT